MSAPQNQGLIQQVKGFFNDRFEDLKVGLGYANDHPQAKVQHSQNYLNDIAKGNWKLKRWTQTTIKYRPVVGVPSDYMMDSVKLRKFDRNPLLEQIRKGHKLKHVQTNDKTGLLIENGWRSRKPVDHKKLLSEINGFSLSKLRPVDKNRPPRGRLVQRAKGFLADKLEDLKTILGLNDYPQKNMTHTKEYLNDIVKGNWKLNRWTQTSIKYRPVVNVPADFMMDSVKLRKFDRNPLLEQIRKDHKLHHVKTTDKTTTLIEKGWKSRKPLDRKKFLSEVVSTRKLNHVQTVDKTVNNTKVVEPKNTGRKELMTEIRQTKSAVKSGSS